MENISIPLALTCKVTGITRSFTNRAWLEKKAKEHGSLQAFKDSYVCREAKALVKKGKGIEQAREILNISAPGLQSTVEVENIIAKIRESKQSSTAIAYEKMDFKVGSPIPLSISTSPADSCLNPAWFLDKNPCEQCQFSSICNFTRKRIAA